jgi:hypothetical protein
MKTIKDVESYTPSIVIHFSIIGKCIVKCNEVQLDNHGWILIDPRGHLKINVQALESNIKVTATHDGVSLFNDIIKTQNKYISNLHKHLHIINKHGELF